MKAIKVCLVAGLALLGLFLASQCAWTPDVGAQPELVSTGRSYKVKTERIVFVDIPQDMNNPPNTIGPMFIDKKGGPNDAARYVQYQVNQTGAFILHFLLKGVDPADIRPIDMKEYGVDSTVATNDINTLINTLTRPVAGQPENHSKPEDATLKKREEGGTSKAAGLLGLLGLISILIYVINPDWLAFASLPFPTQVRWAGVGFALLGFELLQWSQTTLGKSWSDTPRMMKEQDLITQGPYRYIRHPIYTAFLLILGSTLFISSNWLIGVCMIGMTGLEIISRIQYEEALMIEYFGEQYRLYMEKTGRILPRLNPITYL